MAAWVWIIIAIAAVVVLGAVAWAAWRKRRTGALRQRFGPEYDRAVTEKGNRRRAESELDARRKRRQKLDIRPLTPAARQRYGEEWKNTQAKFVDSPSAAVRQADTLVIAVMRDRGYPMEDFEQRSADVSVDHPQVVHDYRAAHAISMANDHERASTEDLRQAMVHYRSLFDELLSSGEGEEEERREAR
jgi:hypothetical protein